jgi:hypothetical protein
MNESDVLEVVLSHLRGVLSIPVQLETTEAGIEIPGLVVSDVVFLPRDRYHGHQTYAGTIVDGSGVETGFEQHFYYEFECDLIARSTSQEEADDVLMNVFQSFAPFADDPRGLHGDFSTLEIGTAVRRVLTAREPDWYETQRSLSIVFLIRVQTTADSLASVDDVIDPSLGE